MFNFEKLIVWQKAVKFSDEIYEMTKRFPKEEIFGITSQLRRASISIALNIDEGAGRKSKKEFSHFLAMAYGSLCEVITILKICLSRKYIDEKIYVKFYTDGEEIARMISSISKR
ncbi:MAG: four helix bundle protein [Elusimicrobiota bacterium]